MSTGCSTFGVEVEEVVVVVVLRLRTDKIEGNCAWEGRWLIYLAGLLLSTPPPCRTHRLAAAGSEVEGADSSLGANIIDRYGRTRCQGGWMLGQESSARASTALATSVLILYNFFFLDVLGVVQRRERCRGPTKEEPPQVGVNLHWDGRRSLVDHGTRNNENPNPLVLWSGLNMCASWRVRHSRAYKH